MPTNVTITVTQDPATRVIEVAAGAAIAALTVRVAALEAGGGGGGGDSAVRIAGATLTAGQSEVALTLSAGEKVVGVSPQAVTGLIWQGVTVSGTTHTLQFSGTQDTDLALRVTIET